MKALPVSNTEVIGDFIEFGSAFFIFLLFVKVIALSMRTFKVSILQLSVWEPSQHLCTSHNEISLLNRTPYSLWCQNTPLFTTASNSTQIEPFYVKKFATYTWTRAHTTNDCWINANVQQTFKMFHHFMYSSNCSWANVIIEPAFWNAKHSLFLWVA